MNENETRRTLKCANSKMQSVGTINKTAHTMQLKTKFHISTLIGATNVVNSPRHWRHYISQASDPLSVWAFMTKEFTNL